MRGEVTRDEIRTLTRKRAMGDLFSAEMLAQGGNFDVVVADGDLHVPGDLDLAKRRLTGLIVRGSLVVGGLLTDSRDPASGLCVHGDLTASRIVSQGQLYVQGTLTAKDILVGFYNDYGAQVADLVTPLFCPENHHFEVQGRLRAAQIAGRGAVQCVPKKLAKEAEKHLVADLATLFVDAVLQRAGENVELDAQALRKHVLANKPVLRAR